MSIITQCMKWCCLQVKQISISQEQMAVNRMAVNANLYYFKCSVLNKRIFRYLLFTKRLIIKPLNLFVWLTGSAIATKSPSDSSVIIIVVYIISVFCFLALLLFFFFFDIKRNRKKKLTRGKYTAGYILKALIKQASFIYFILLPIVTDSSMDDCVYIFQDNIIIITLSWKIMRSVSLIDKKRQLYITSHYILSIKSNFIVDKLWDKI